jgi:hypothetical protein
LTAGRWGRTPGRCSLVISSGSINPRLPFHSTSPPVLTKDRSSIVAIFCCSHLDHDGALTYTRRVKRFSF